MSNSILKVQFEELPPAGKTKEEVIRFFESADSKITDVDLSTDGVAIVTFANADDADKLLRNPPVFDGVQLKARRCVPKRLPSFTLANDTSKPPLTAKGPAIPHEATSSHVGKATDQKKGSIVRTLSENRNSKPKPRIPSKNYRPSNQAILVSDLDGTRSSNVQTPQPQQNLDDVAKIVQQLQQQDLEHTDAVKVYINENTSLRQVEPIIAEPDNCKAFETTLTETCVTELELPSEQQGIGHTDATADKVTELKLPSERIKLIKILMNAKVLDLAYYDCQLTCDEQNGKIILTGHSCYEAAVRLREKLDTMVSKEYPMANRFLQTRKGENWLTTEFRKLNLLSVCYTKNKASLVLAKDEECLHETITVLGNVLDSETVSFGNECLQSELNHVTMALNSEYMVLVETDFDRGEITIEGNATDVKLVTSFINASVKDCNECSRKVKLAEIAGSLLNKFQNEIRNSVDKELSLQQRVKLVFNPLSLEILGSNRDAEGAEKIITEQYIKAIQEHSLTADDIGRSIEDFGRKDSYEAFIVQQLEEKYRCVIRVEVSSKLDVKAEETLRPASNIAVVKGDITQFTDADVLVNPIAAETSDLRKAGVVSLMFAKAGNQALQKVFDQAGAPISFGRDVTVTGPAGTILAKKIFHPAIRKYRNEKSIKVD